MENKVMKAVILTDANKFELREVPIPEPGEHQVLVKVISSPINPSDLLCIDGSRKLSYPSPLGAEGHGTVIKAGGKDGEQLVGKKVSYYTFSPNTWAEYAVISLFELFDVPDNISAEAGASAYLNPVTVMGLYENIKKGDHKAVVITTASACSKMLFRLLEADKIPTIAVVRKDDQKQICLDSGATHVLNSNDPKFDESLKALAQEIKATCCIECILGPMLERILNALPSKSEIIFYGRLDSNPNVSLNVMNWLMHETTIRPYIFINYVFGMSPEKKAVVFDKIRKELDTTFKTDQSKIFKLEEFNEAFDYYLKNMSKGKVVLSIGQ